MAIYNPPKAYEQSNTGSTISSFGSVVSAIPTPYTKAAGVALNLIGGVVGQNEQNKYNESIEKIEEYNNNYKVQDTLEKRADQLRIEQEQMPSFDGVRSKVLRYGTSRETMSSAQVPSNGGTGLINNRLI